MLKESEIKIGDTHTATLVEDLKRTQIVQLKQDVAKPDFGRE